MLECLTVNISFDTSFEDIELLRLEMEKFVRHPDNSRDFQPDFSVGVTGVNDLDKLSLSIAIQHKSNWHNDAVRATRRSKFMCALALALKKVPIYGPGGGYEALGAPGNPSYAVTVSDSWAATSRGDAAKAKDALRMYPVTKPADENEAFEQERQAAAGINNRPVVPETVGLWEEVREGVHEDRLSTAHEQAEDRRRSRDIEAVRSDLLKRASTRGRRRAGESLPSLSMDAGSGAGLAPTQSARSPHSPLETFDEEAATGMPSTYYDINRSRSNGGGSTTGLQQPPHGIGRTPSQQRRQGQSQGWEGPPPAQR